MVRDLARLVLVLSVICMASALTLAAVYDLTEEPIAHQRRLMMLRSLKMVMPPFDNEPDQDTKVVQVGGEKGEVTFFQGMSGGEVVGVAMIAITKNGWSGDIDVMVGFNPQGDIQGIRILRHLETPGLGDKIAKPKFTDLFKGRNLENTNWLVKKDGGDIDQITGATISPRAVVEAVKDGLETFKKHYLGESS